MLTSTLILPGESEPRALGWEIKEELDAAVDVVVEAGETLAEPTTVVDWSEGAPEIVRVGAGDPGRFVAA
jgi:tRNA A37 threonylcarbamoyladenosine synthetase subunit TsaC/SUA5/YrdC